MAASTLEMAKVIRALGAGIVLLGASAAWTGAAAETFSFGLWGDMPYEKANDAPKIPALIASINASNIAFSIYDGDIKDGSSKCTDNIYSDALSMFGQMKQPVVYIPGDNEWTDCHRTNNGGYDNLERLAFVRKTMFATPGSLGQSRMPMDHQGKPGEKYVENTRFVHRGVVFVGLNVPGSNNNKVLDEKDCTSKSARTQEHCAADNAEYVERDAANIAVDEGRVQGGKGAEGIRHRPGIPGRPRLRSSGNGGAGRAQECVGERLHGLPRGCRRGDGGIRWPSDTRARRYAFLQDGQAALLTHEGSCEPDQGPDVWQSVNPLATRRG